MPVKISKVAKDLNVGTSTIIEFLSKKNITVESNPNARISDEHYKMLLDAFRTDMEESDGFRILHVIDSVASLDRGYILYVPVSGFLC